MIAVDNKADLYAETAQLAVQRTEGLALLALRPLTAAFAEQALYPPRGPLAPGRR